MLEVVIAAAWPTEMFIQSNYAKTPLLWALSCNFIFITSRLDLRDLLGLQLFAVGVAFELVADLDKLNKLLCGLQLYFFVMLV